MRVAVCSSRMGCWCRRVSPAILLYKQVARCYNKQVARCYNHSSINSLCYRPFGGVTARVTGKGNVPLADVLGWQLNRCGQRGGGGAMLA
jgi:hypothetical protein